MYKVTEKSTGKFTIKLLEIMRNNKKRKDWFSHVTEIVLVHGDVFKDG